MVKRMHFALLAGAAAAAIVAGTAGCAGGSTENVVAASAGSSAAAESAPTESIAETDPASEHVPVTAAELAIPDVTVAYGDYDAMAQLASDIQNGRMDGQVVEVDGVITHFMSGMSYNIMEPNADGSEKRGTMFVIEGHDYTTDEDAYPVDEAHVKLTGKVGLDSEGIYYLIYTLPEFVEVLE